MNFKRAIAVSVSIWVLVFFEVSILMFGFKLQTGVTYYLIHYIFLAVFACMGAKVYFSKAKAGAIEGLYLGLVGLVSGIILDSLITVMLFVKSYTFFLDIYLWIGYIEMISLMVLFGAIKKAN